MSKQIHNTALDESDEPWGVLEQEGVLESVQKFRPRAWMKKRWESLAHGVEGVCQIAGEEHTLQVLLKDTFPLSLPIILLKTPESAPMLPHVDADGFICVFDEEGLLLDSARPGKILLETVKQAQELLERGLTGTNARDFNQEFGAYWGCPQSKVLITDISPVGGPRIVYKREVKRARFVISDISPGTRSAGARPVDGIYLPLRADKPLMPPQFGECWNIPELLDIIESHALAEDRELMRSLNLPRQKEHFILFGLPVELGSLHHTLFGATLTPTKRSELRGIHHPLMPKGSRDLIRIEPFKAYRWDAGYIVERGGGYTSLMKQRVLVIGCGAVGSLMAEQLARAGVGDLTLLDKDVLTSDNLYRHALGCAQVSDKKAVALAQQLEQGHPKTRVHPIASTIEHRLDEEPCFLNAYDLVVVAIGNPTIERHLNTFAHTHRHVPPMLYTWLEPLGIGGHALLTHIDSSERGCYECLLEPSSLHNRASFAAPRQSFTKRLTGCAAGFVPYGGLHASKTANLATELAIDYLRCRVDTHELRSWKGDATDFEEQGYSLSPRHRQSPDELATQKLSYIRVGCNKCGAP